MFLNIQIPILIPRNNKILAILYVICLIDLYCNPKKKIFIILSQGSWEYTIVWSQRFFQMCSKMDWHFRLQCQDLDLDSGGRRDSQSAKECEELKLGPHKHQLWTLEGNFYSPMLPSLLNVFQAWPFTF